MRSAVAFLTGGRALPTAARSSPPSLHKTWQPNRGIVFGSNASPATRRQFSAVGLSEDQLLQHSTAEDNYVMAAQEDAPATPVKSAATTASNAAKIIDAPEGSEIPAKVQEEHPERNELPETTFKYKMTEELFRAAKDAQPLTTESYWLHTLYRGPSDLPDGKKVTVHYCHSKHATENILQRYFMNQEVLGFDIEWNIDATKNSGPKKNVALVQLACEERIVLIHVALFAKDKLEDLVAPSLKKIMEDPEITKVGVSIKADCTRVRKYLQIDSHGLFELSHLYKLIKYSASKDYKKINKQLVSLATQVQEHLHLPMFKGEVRSSDWSKQLNMGQITYAAADSYAGVQLYNVLELKRQALDPTPPRPYHADLNKPIRLAEGIELAAEEPTTEDLEPEDAEPPPDPSTPIPQISNLPQSEVESDSDADFEPSQDLPTPSSSPITRSKTTSSPKAAKHPLLIAADQHTLSYRSQTAYSTLTHRATPANLRAYYLWSLNPSLTLSEIAAIMRSPPVQTRTVAHYILEAVKLEGFECEKERVREVLGVWFKSGGAKGPMAKRYWKLEEDVGFVARDGSK